MPARRPPARRKPTRAPKRRARKVLNPRPIPLDDGAIESLLDRLYATLRRKADRYPKAKVNPDGPPVVIAQDSIWITPVNRPVERVAVVITATPDLVRFVGGGGYGHSEGRPVVVASMNGRYPWEALADERVTRGPLGHLLRHELTHSADVPKSARTKLRGGSRRGLSVPGLDDLESVADYYNEPHEVRAYMREIHDELRANVTKVMRSPLGREWGLGGTVSRLLNSNETWAQVSPYLTPRNRRRVLLGVVRAFRDDGL